MTSFDHPFNNDEDDYMFNSKYPVHEAALAGDLVKLRNLLFVPDEDSDDSDSDSENESTSNNIEQNNTDAEKKTPKVPQYHTPHDLLERDELNECTALHYALLSKNVDVVSALLLSAGERGAHQLLNKRNDGSFPIHTALQIANLSDKPSLISNDNNDRDCFLVEPKNVAPVITQKLHDFLQSSNCSRKDLLHLILGVDPVYINVTHEEFSSLTLKLIFFFCAELGQNNEYSKDPETIFSILSQKDDSLQTPLYLITRFNNLDAFNSIASELTKSDLTNLINQRGERTGMRAWMALSKFANLSDNLRKFDQLFTQLIQNGANLTAVNIMGQNCLHLAFMAGNWHFISSLISHDAVAAQNLMFSDDLVGLKGYEYSLKRGLFLPRNIIDWIEESQKAGGIVKSTDENTHNNTETTNDSTEKIIVRIQQTRDLLIDPPSQTLLVSHPSSNEHHTCPPPITLNTNCDSVPPENVHRLSVLLDEKIGVLHTKEFQNIIRSVCDTKCPIGDVLRVHDYSYISKIVNLTKQLDGSQIHALDADTTICRQTWDAALYASGSVIEAIDKVMNGDARNAFVAARPPGHHAGPRGIVTCANDPDGSHGFCLLNHVAIGAAYARSTYRGGPNGNSLRVAIIDFDVHHGNGTEAIIKESLLPKIEYTQIKTTEFEGHLQNVKYKPWLNENDVDDVFFASSHGFGAREYCGDVLPPYGGWFYPASGEPHISDALIHPSVSKQGISSDEFLLTQTWARMGSEARGNCCKIINCGLSLPNPNDLPGSQRLALRDSYRKTILPKLYEFNPDLILLSAGFDAHRKDSMNNGYVGMVEEDYEWLTGQLVKVANSCCQGRIVSCLEGGYKIHGGIVSPFARSVAAHVRGLVDGGLSREKFSMTSLEWESHFEKQLIEEKERKRKMKLERELRLIPTMSTRELRLIPTMSTNTTAAAMDTSNGNGSSHHHISQHVVGVNEHELLNAPLNDTGTNLHVEVDTTTHAEKEDEPIGEGDGIQSRKRRRPQVDYKKLYEEMKKEESQANAKSC